MQSLVDRLMEGWAKLHTAAPRTRAYLLLESWNDNAMAAAIQQDFASMADDRQAVPDRHFEHREDDAPCLLPLTEAFAPSAPTDSGSTVQAREALVDWLAHASGQAAQRLSKQELCALVFSDAEPASILRHWVQLGDQKAPAGAGARLFRYQDPRVMQRVWPTLSAPQKLKWLGPVAAWWALAQPWSAWDASADVPAASFAVWRAELDEDTTALPVATRALFSDAQWQAAHIAPAGHRVWARYRDEAVPAFHQPDGETMERLLSEGGRMGLVDTNLEDYVWCTWRSNARAGEPRERPWYSPRGTAILTYVLDALGRQPQARFASLYAEALTRL